MAIDLEMDAGHGGRDPGACGPTGVRESDATLDITKRAGELIEAQGFSVGYTRTSDVYVGLEERAAIANNAGAKHFIAIHINSASAAATGTETFCYSLGDATTYKLAKCLQTRVVEAVGKHDRGVKEADFAVLRETAMPAALVEVLFISNPSEEALLKDPAFIEKVAVAIAKGYCDYRGKTYVEKQPEAPPKPSVMYRVILDGTQIMALSNYDDAVERVKAAVDSNQATTGKVQRNTDSVDLFTYAKPVAPPPPVGTPILTAATATMQQAWAWAIANKAPQLFIDLAATYWELAPKLGINPAMAYVQFAHETGFLYRDGKSGAGIDASYCNPCGLKVTQGGGDTQASAHKRFANWREGIQAHLDHIGLYAGAPGYPKAETPDPRHFPYLLGTAKNIEDLGGKWAPSADYGKTLVDKLNALNSAVGLPDKPGGAETTQEVQTLTKRVNELTEDLNAKIKEAENYKMAAEQFSAQVKKLEGDLAAAKEQLVDAEKTNIVLSAAVRKWDTLKQLLKELIGG